MSTDAPDPGPVHDDEPTPAQRLILVVLAFAATAVFVVLVVWLVAVVFG